MATDVARGNTARPISREILEDRWNGLVTAPWRAGEHTKLWQRLQDVLVELARGMTRREFDLADGPLGSPDNVYELTEPLEEQLRQSMIRLVDERGLALTGWEGITGEPPAAVQ